LPEPDRHSLVCCCCCCPGCQAYKGIKAILAAVLFSFIDPSTGTNPFFEAIGYEPGTKVQDTAVGPPPAGAADQEELIASAHINMPQVLQVMTKPAAVQVSGWFRFSAWV
jgi:hypothetical protein